MAFVGDSEGTTYFCGGFVGGEHQHEVGRARDVVALHHFGRLPHRSLEGVDDVGALAFERHQDDHGQAPPERLRGENRDVAFDDFFIAETLSAAQAWVLAAQNVGKPVSLVSVLSSKLDSKTGWTGLHVAGFNGFQRVRLTAFPTYTQGVRPAYESIVLDAKGGKLTGYREFVDAQTGAVLFRYNGVQQLSDSSRTGVSTLSGAAASNASSRVSKTGTP